MLVVALGAGGCGVVRGALAGAEPVRAADGSITAEGDVAPSALRVGDCMTLGAEATTDEPEVWTVHVTPCDEPHDSEAYARWTIPSGEFPGAKVVMAEADVFCYDELLAFLGPAAKTSTLEYTYYYPTPESYELGDHQVLCVAVDPRGGIVGRLAPS